ncbi:MAG: LapD/MoxY N-terminal periplasmic domain-containing protein, partial [Natronospirillum sp.]
MSLIKQLWIGIGLLMLLAFGGSFLVSTYSAKDYIEQQIQVKDIDNVTALALSMSQMDKDLVTLELLIAAQFDAGHYQQIVLRDNVGNPLVERYYEGEHNFSAPTWFHRAVTLETQPASALVQDGWQQFGELTVESHSGFSVDSLWTGTQRLIQWFLILGVLGGMLGTWFLKSISRPMDIVVGQAEAIGDRRFIYSKEPKTREFRRLVKAMNTLSSRVKTMLDKEQQQLESLRRRVSHDELTGLPNREHFLGHLDHVLSDPDAS